jgi:hypothetical protein
LGPAWDRLATLLELHTIAEEEICYPVLFRCGPYVLDMIEEAIADHNDIREAVAEARLLEAGTARWWRPVEAAHKACLEHFPAEEKLLLDAICYCLRPRTTQLLSRQWTRFVTSQASRASNL